MLPLRICRVCGLKAFTENDLNKFTKDKRCHYKRQTICKNCTNKYNNKWRKDYGYKEVHTQRRLKLISGFKKPLKCHFCGELITKLNGQDKYSIIIHSLDGNHENWYPENKVPVHNSCHTIHHNTSRIGRKLTPLAKQKISASLTGRFRGKNHWNWKGDDAKEKSKKHRKWREKTRRSEGEILGNMHLR